MKKTLLALAVLSVAGSVQASNVSVYGVIDTGLAYTYQNEHDIQGNSLANGRSDFLMETGIHNSSRFGIKGTEDLGNGLTIGIKLENGFNSDNGKLGNGDRLFGREAAVFLMGDFGTLVTGRIGAIGAAAGYYDTVFAIGESFDGGDYKIYGLAVSERYDNMIVYETPEFAGNKIVAQYSFDGDSKKDENDFGVKGHGTEGKSSVDRYASLSFSGHQGALSYMAAYEYFDHSTDSFVKKDGHLFHMGGNYDFGVTKLFAMGQYFQGIRNVAGWNMKEDIIPALSPNIETDGTDGFKGYGLHVGSITPVFGGDLMLGAYYVDAKLDNTHVGSTKENYDTCYVGLTGRFVYPLSKRTDVYVGGGYAKSTFDNNTPHLKNGEKELFQAYTGIAHRF